MHALFSVWNAVQNGYFTLISEILVFLSKFDIGFVSKHIPCLFIGVAGMRAEDQGRRDTDQSIRISATSFITLLVAIIAGTWVLFSRYLDSQLESVSNEIRHANVTMLAEVKNITSLVSANKDNVQVNRATLSNLTNRMNTVDKLVAGSIGEVHSELSAKLDQIQLGTLRKFSEVEKEISKLSASHSVLLHGMHPEQATQKSDDHK
jgi:putative N-acetylmannosamine-6-phosphate epimerase